MSMEMSMMMTTTSQSAGIGTTSLLPITAVNPPATGVPAPGEFTLSIDEWDQFARSFHIRPVGISEFFGQQPLLHPDPVEEYRDQG